MMIIIIFAWCMKIIFLLYSHDVLFSQTCHHSNNPLNNTGYLNRLIALCAKSQTIINIKRETPKTNFLWFFDESLIVGLRQWKI